MTPLPVIPKEKCQELHTSLRSEWLETNGNGGYASSTIHNCNTRKYHGLLVAGLANPAGRFTLLSKYEDSIITATGEYPLSSNCYPGVMHPDGHRYLTEFRLEEGPVFRYQFEGMVIQKRLLMVQGENTVLVEYQLEQSQVPVRLRLKPLLAFRRHHELKQEDTLIHTQSAEAPDGFSIHPYDGLPPLYIQASQPPRFEAQPVWYRNLEYFMEAERGYDYHEDCFCPGTLELTLPPQGRVIVSASLLSQQDLPATWDKEHARRQACAREAEAVALHSGDPDMVEPLPALIRSGLHFTIRTPGSARATIIAGYPWFDDWGRDTLISLPGLTFYSGRPELGIEILKAVAPHERDGLIPNCFAADPEHHAYNSVDASLWYFWAVQQMLECTGDRKTLHDTLWPVLKRIATRFMAGTHYDVFMTPEGLLHAGNRNTQLTWMDATSHGQPVTPRYGFAVELNALWFNALVFCETLATSFHEKLPWPADLTKRLKTAFTSTFWLEGPGYLADSFAEGILNESIRPNQIFAASLPFSPLTARQRKSVVETVRRDLFTPYGLRTLAPHDVAYRGRYEGDQPTRDAAYHQGTVWPWLLGHYGEAVLKTSSTPAQAALELSQQLRPLLDYSLKGRGLINVPEIFDGDSPQRPNGCPAQAWSSAELIRLFTLCGRTCSR
ncbi:MAG: amylo-alpha-1,6-glucosidase [bacterium]|jgi:predicted glycogen debranching enzyme